MNELVWNTGGLIKRLRENPVTVPLCPPTVPSDLAWNWTQTFKTVDWWLTTRAKAWPLKKEQHSNYKLQLNVKCSCYRPGVAQRVGRGIALLFHDHGTRRGWVVSSTPQPHFTPRKDPVPILQEARWAPGLVWMGRKSHPHWDSILDRPARSQSLYWLRYPAHINFNYIPIIREKTLGIWI